METAMNYLPADAPPQHVILAESCDPHQVHGPPVKNIETLHSKLINCSQCQETLVRLAN